MKDKIQKDLVAAMKSGQALKVSVLRMLLSELNYKKIEVQRDLVEADVIGVVQKEIKKRREAIDSYTVGGRTEQAEIEKKEMEILQVYLPVQISEEELRKEIEKEVKKMDEGLRSNFGQVMRVISPMFRGKADGGLVAKIVKEFLA